MDKATFKKIAEIVESIDDAYISIITKKYMIDMMMAFDENGNLDNWDDDNYWYLYAGGKLYTNEEITRTIARKADYIELSDGYGWTIYIGRNCDAETLRDAFNASIGWLIDCKVELAEMPIEAAEALIGLGVEIDMNAVEEATEQADTTNQEADNAEQTDEQAEQEAPKAHHTIYSECTPCYAPTFAYDVSHARTYDEQQAFLERATQPTDAPASETAEDETWFCGNATQPTDPDTANQDADTAALSRTAEDNLYHQRAAQQATERAKRRGPIAFIITLIVLIMCISSAGTIAHALTKTAGPLITPATAITGDQDMATRIPATQKQTTTTTKPAKPATSQAPTTTATAPAPEQAQAPTTTATAPAPEQPKAPTLAELLAKALEAQKTAKTAPQTPAETPTAKETLSLKTALKRALMAPKTGTTECVIYSTLYAAIRIEEVTTAPTAPVTETPEDADQETADQETKSAWTIATDTRRIAFMRELRNVTRGRAYNDAIMVLLKAIDQSDDDYLWNVPGFTSLPAELQKAIKERFEAKECQEAEREECRTALDPHSERITLHRTAIETACETLARTAPEWTPLLFEETPAPATLRQAILELQYCIFPIDSSPRARVFRGLEGIDFKTLSTPQDYQAACKAASLRAGEPSTAIPPEARARIIQWRSGDVSSTSAAAVTSTAARLAQVWGMD